MSSKAMDQWDRRPVTSPDSHAHYVLTLAVPDRDACDRCNATPERIHYMAAQRPVAAGKSQSLMLCNDCAARELARQIGEGR